MRQILIVLLGVFGAVAIAQGALSRPAARFLARAHAVPASGPSILYEQMDSAGQSSTSSQDFEAAYDDSDVQIADDFVVPAGATWAIGGVDVVGVYFNGSGPAESFNVYFHADADGAPGALVDSRMAQPYTNGASAVIRFASPVVLPAGSYWLSVQARMDYATGGQWGWTDRTVAANNPSMFRNPLGGLTPGCTDWTLKTDCATTVDPDMLFRLVGTGAGDALFCSGFEVGETGACEGSVNGDIVFSGPINHAIQNDVNGTSVNWITGDIQDADVSDYHFNPYNNSKQLTFWWNTGASDIAGVAATAATSDFLVLPSGAVVGPASAWSTTNNPGPAAWAATVDGYLGFRFNCASLPNAPASGICYGYVHLSTTAPDGFPATILDYAYNNTGTEIMIP